MLEVERWAEIRRMRFVERLSIREIARRTSLGATPSLYQPPIFRAVRPGVMLRRHSVAHLLSAYPGGWHLKRECHGILISPQERMSTFLPDPGPGCGVHANP